MKLQTNLGSTCTRAILLVALLLFSVLCVMPAQAVVRPAEISGATSAAPVDIGATDVTSLSPDQSGGLDSLIELSPATQGSGMAVEPTYHPDILLVKFKQGVSASAREAVHNAVGGTRLHSFNDLPVDTVLIPEGGSLPDYIDLYGNRPEVEYAEPNFKVTIQSAPDEPYFSWMWGLRNTGQANGTPGADINVLPAWDVTTGSTDVIVGVIDTGIDYTHPDLAANMWVNPNPTFGDLHGASWIDGSGVPTSGDPMDDLGHGTHCAGTIGAVANNGAGAVGVCPHVRLMALKFINKFDGGYIADAVSALDYAVAHGAKISSNSWGGGAYSQTLHDAIAAAGSTANHLFVVAAGNSASNNDTSPSYPASYDCANVVAVASGDNNDQPSSFTNYGATSVDLAAPGSDILSTFPGGGVGVISGTSMATPHVSGVVALLRSVQPTATYQDVKGWLLGGVTQLSQWSTKVASGGELNAAASLSLAHVPGGDLTVDNYDRFVSSGNPGGPFTTTSKTYTMTNVSATNTTAHSISWTASVNQTWVSLSATSGSLAAGDSFGVSASINSNAQSLPVGNYEATVTMTDTNAGVAKTRGITLTVWNATTIHVKPNGNDANDGSTWALAKQTVGGAMSAAFASDEIWIKCGTYSENNIPCKAGVSIYGGFAGNESTRTRDWAANPTILDGGGTRTVLMCSPGSDSTTVIDGLTVANGYTPFNGGGAFLYDNSSTISNCTFTGNGSGMYGEGSAICFWNNSNGLMTNCTITDNISEQIGAGAFVGYSSTTISNCTFENNTSLLGAGMGIGAANPTVTNCAFTDNICQVDNNTGSGCGIFLVSGNPTISNCSFTGGYGFRGGAMWLQSGTPVVTNCTFADNTVTVGGGSICSVSCSPHVTDCTFTGGRRAPNGDGTTAQTLGGAVYATGGYPVFTNCTFADNVAYNVGGMACQNTRPTVVNCTFAGNVGAIGAALATSGSSFLTNCSVSNSIFWGDSALTQVGHVGTGVLAINNSCVQNGSYTSGQNNISSDPLLIAIPDPAGNYCGDLRLQPSSPCLDTGDNTAIPSGITTDLIGNPRIANNVVDMGAYEGSVNAVAAPELSLPAGKYADQADVVVTCQTTGASIHYTTNGVDPTVNDATIQSGGTVSVNQTLTLKAKAWLGGLASGVTAATYHIAVDTPSFTPDGGCFGSNQSVTISCSISGVTIHYTTNGNDPTTSDPTVVSGGSVSVSVSPMTTLKAKAWMSPLEPSDVKTALYRTSQHLTFHVTPSGSDSNLGIDWNQPKGSIQSAIDLAASGDEIWVAAGTYVGNITLKDGVGLYGGFAGTETVRSQRDASANVSAIDGNQNFCMAVTAPETTGPTTVIDGFTITTSSRHQQGIGIYCLGEPVITNNILTHWASDQYTGYTILINAGNPTIEFNRIVDNTTTPVYVCSSAKIFDNYIGQNPCPSYPGIAVWSQPTDDVEIGSNVIVGNGNAFTAYGAMYLAMGNSLIINNTIVGNTIGCQTQQDGAGIDVYAFSGYGAPTIMNNIVAFNSAVAAGSNPNNCGAGGVYISYEEPGLVFDYNDVYGNTSSYSPYNNYDLGYGVSIGSHNPSVNPLLVNVSNGDYHLQVGSPCIDTGYDNAPGLPPIDMDNQARTFGAHVDIGADEYVLPAVISTVPANGATDVRVSTCISATFNDDIVASSITSSTFIVKDPFNYPVAGDISYDSATRTATFKSTNALATGGTYSAKVTSGISDAQGHHPSSDYTWSFTTATQVYHAIVRWDAPGPVYDGQSWPTAFATIQDGLNAVGNGEEIWVAGADASTIAGNSNAGKYSGNYVMKSGVRLLGGYTAMCWSGWWYYYSSPSDFKSVLDGNAAGNVVTIPAGTNTETTIDGFTIQNAAGAGVFSQGSVTISDNVFTGNTNYGGAGIQAWGIGTVSMYDNSIVANSGLGVEIGIGSLSMIANTISQNTEDGAWIESPSSTIMGNAFNGNGGTGLSVALGDSSVILNDISGNASTGLYIGTTSPSIQVADNTIIGNDTGSLNNTGGIYCAWDTAPAITNNTVAYNAGTGIKCDVWTAATIENNIVAFNACSSQNGGGLDSASTGIVQDYNDVYGNTSQNSSYNNYGSGITPGSHSIGVDPGFYDKDNGDYRLTYGSGCIDAGLNTAPQIPSMDKDGKTRILDGNGDTTATVDMGAYEFRRFCVKTTGNDNNDGSSWDLAKQTIDGAVYSACRGDEIWIAQGTYPESVGVQDGMKILGGFSGTGTTRDWNQYVTTIGSYAALMEDCTQSTVVEGLTFTGSYEVGGGCLVSGSPTIRYNIFNGTHADYGGGAIITNLGSPKIVNNVFSGDSSDSNGGAIEIYGGSALVISNTFENNTSPTGGGLYISGGATPVISNNIIVGSTGYGIYNDGGAPVLGHNDVYNNSPGNYHGISAASTDISVNPALADLWHLSSVSPCIDAGDDNAQGLPVFDLDKQDRIHGAHVDIGADEYEYTIPAVVSTNPASSATNVRVSSTIAATFNENMTASTINSNTFVVKDSGNNTVAGGVVYNTSTNTATFTATNALATGATYTAKVTTGAADSAGHHLASDYTWSFTTASEVYHALVNGNAPGPVHDGSSWNNAFLTVQQGINAVGQGEEVWVASGTYNQCITLKNATGVYGGFAGSETARSQRNWQSNKTILDAGAQNSVVSCPTGCGSATAIDGFTIQNGNAYMGGGIYCYMSSITVANNIIQNNTACVGAGAYMSGNNVTPIYPVVTNNVIADNDAVYSTQYPNVTSVGGGFYMFKNYGQYTNNTIVGNSAESWGSGVAMVKCVASIRNNIIAFNTYMGIGYEIEDDGSVLDYNDVYGNGSYNYWGLTPGSHSISVDPAFYDYDDGDYHLTSASPCIDTGLNTAPAIPTNDLDGKTRILDGNNDSTATVDMGAYEFRRFCVSTTGSDSNNGSSWSLAKRTIAGAFTSATNGDEIWVAQGTYDESGLHLHNGMKLLGGFAGSGATRDWRTYVTALSSTQYNSTVVTTDQQSTLATLLEGFTITGMNYGNGGGGCLVRGSAIVRYNIFSNCAAMAGGALILNGSSRIINNVFSGSMAYGPGGAILSYGSSIITNNTFRNNTTYNDGGALYIDGGSPVISNNIVVGSTGYGIYCYGTTTSTLSHNDVYGNSPSNYYGVSPGNGDISADPLITGVWELSSTSPCINAGDDNALGLPLIDIDGQDRIYGTSVDIGADEYQP